MLGRPRGTPPLPRPWRTVLWLLPVVLAACVVRPEIHFFPDDRRARAAPAVGPLSAEESLQRGLYPEVEAYLRSLPPATVAASPSLSALAGQASLARGDYGAARPVLERARKLEARSARRAEIEWGLSQGAILWNDFAAAASYAAAAVRDGYGLVPGFQRFLEAFAGTDVYGGPAAGASRTSSFERPGFDLIQTPVAVNGVVSAAVLDSGAVYCIVTRSFAKEASVREIPDSLASGRGLHKKEFPVTFGTIDWLDFGGFTLTNVPVMIMPDDALLFETARGPFPVPVVIGLHLLKEFAAEIDYAQRTLTLTRTDFRVPKRDPEQNLFWSRGRAFARASVNGSGFFQFLLDTGSETTMVTSAGLSRMGVAFSTLHAADRVYGLGKARAEHGRVSDMTVAMAGFGARYRGLLVLDDTVAFEDGIVGNAFLSHFKVRIDFSRMVLNLERPRPPD